MSVALLSRSSRHWRRTPLLPCDGAAGEICYVGQCIVPSGACTGMVCATKVESDCPNGELCDPELGQCVPNLGDPTCAFEPEVGGFDPVAFLEKVKTRVVTMHASDRYLVPGATLDELRQSDGSIGVAAAPSGVLLSASAVWSAAASFTGSPCPSTCMYIVKG